MTRRACVGVWLDPQHIIYVKAESERRRITNAEVYRELLDEAIARRAMSATVAVVTVKQLDLIDGLLATTRRGVQQRTVAGRQQALAFGKRAK